MDESTTPAGVPASDDHEEVTATAGVDDASNGMPADAPGVDDAAGDDGEAAGDDDDKKEEEGEEPAAA